MQYNEVITESIIAMQWLSARVETTMQEHPWFGPGRRCLPLYIQLSSRVIVFYLFDLDPHLVRILPASEGALVVAL